MNFSHLVVLENPSSDGAPAVREPVHAPAPKWGTFVPVVESKCRQALTNVVGRHGR